ncbi:MAG: hypothetical protein JRH17_20240 [Deltaproteobacteria bacterium]|nr:hypothetical protein [Deltaproteobacteria bacterium]
MAGRRIGRISALALVLALAAGCPGCTTPPPNDDLVCETPESVMKQYLYRRVETDRAARLGRRIEKLSADLAEAEAALARGESGLRGEHSRAAAVSSLAEARIQVERAAKLAPWRPLVVAEAHAKLNDAGKQIEASHFGAALFFVYRAQRLAADLEAEAEKVGRTPGTRFVAGRRVNLRAGPSSSEPVLTILEEGMPVFPESRQQPWVLVRTAIRGSTHTPRSRVPTPWRRRGRGRRR